MDNLIGKTLGQYQIQSLAGRGGMATVYKAYQPSLNRYVALKVLPDYLAQDDQFVVRFDQEARSAAALRHPNIMVVYDVGQESNTHYIAAEYLEGTTLAQVLAQQSGPLPLARTVNILNQLASALDFAHTRGLVHRDIKPSNVFVGPDDHVTLMDFGIAKALSGGGGVTRTGTMIGTPEYMSPEQAEGKTIDQRSDIYSLGVVVYQLLTGRVPFAADTPTAVLLAHVMQTPRPPSQHNPAVPRAVEAVVLRALAKNPTARFGSAGELARALAQAAGQAALTTTQAPASAYVAPTVAIPTPPPGRVATTPPPGYAPTTPPPVPPAAMPQPRKRNWLVWIGAGIGGLIVLCIVGLIGCGALGKLTSTSTPPPAARATATIETQALALATSTPQNVARATATAKSNAGILFNDDFKSQQTSQDNGWTFDTGDGVDYVWSSGKLTLSIKKKQWLGWKTPGVSSDDFGAEVEAQATTSDYAEYGIIFRIGGESDKRSYYVFAVTTDGKYYLQKFVNGQWSSFDPVKTTASPAVKAGTAKNTLRVLARGAQFMLYVNGTLVNTVTDADITTGKIGVIAATGSNNAQAQVAFTRMTVFTAEKAASDWGAPPATGNVLYQDDFSDPASGWSASETDNTAKYYQNGKYTIKIKSPSFTGWSTPENEYFSGGVTVDVDATMTDGPLDNDLGVICQYLDSDNFYYLAISGDGYVGIQKESGGSGLKTISADGKMHTSNAVKQGKGATNHIRAICAPGKLALVVNGTQVLEVEDSDFEEGNVGLAASAYKSGGVIVSFDNFYVSEIP
jgi:serine/threonine protein kinase